MTIEHHNGGITFSGKDVNTYVLIALRSGLKLYAKTGMKPNRAWTPTAMLTKAGAFTSKTYKRGHYQEAIDDLTTLIEGARQ